MIEILDVSLPIISFVLFSLLTIPVVKAIRKRKGETTVLITVWSLTVFITAAVTVMNLAIKYYEQPSPQPFLNITLASEPFAIFSSTFMK